MTENKITVEQMVFPILLLSIVVAGFLAFQTTLLINDRTTLQTAHESQDKPLIEANKVRDQANSLAVGTLRLANAGNKTAQVVIEQLKKNGVNVSETPNTLPAGSVPTTSSPDTSTPAQ